MKKIILLTAIVFTIISCNTSDKLIGKWKAENSRWEAEIVKENGDLFLIGGGIVYDDSKFKLEKKGGSYTISIPPIAFPLEYKNDKLYFNDKVWVRE